MPKYLVEMDGKKYNFEGDHPPSEEEARQALGAPQTQDHQTTPSLESALGQIGKGIYSNPGVQLLAKLVGANKAPEEFYGKIPEASNTVDKIASMIGQATPAIAAVPALTAGAVAAIPAIGTSAIASGAAGMGAYSGLESTAANIQGDNRNILGDMLSGAGQGALWGGLSRAGASITPAVLGGERVGSAIGGAAAGALTSGQGNPDTGINAAFGAAMGAMLPSERFNIIEGLANGVGPVKGLGWENTANVMDKMFGPAYKDAVNSIRKYGFDEVKRAGEIQATVPNGTGGSDTYNAPMLALKSYQDGIKVKRQEIGNKFDEAKAASENINPKDLNQFVTGLKTKVDNFADPTSPVARLFNKTYDALQGFNPTYTETEASGTKDLATPNVRRMNMSELPPALQAQVRQQLGQKGQISKLSLNALHELKQNLQDYIPPNAWKKPWMLDADQRFAMNISKNIGQYIGDNNPLYAQASSEWERMKRVEGEIYDIKPQDLARVPAKLDPTTRLEMQNGINKVENYFRKNGLTNFNANGLLNKYQAYNLLANENTAPLKNVYGVRVGLSLMLGQLGRLVGMGEAGYAAGGLAGWKMSSPDQWLPILKALSQGRNTTRPFSPAVGSTQVNKIEQQP